MPSSLVALNEYLLSLVLLELPLKDLIGLREVCRVLCDATRTKILWISLLHGASSEGKVLPPYIKSYDLLDALTLEALVRRVSILARKWEIKDLCPVNVWRLNLPHSIDWLRLWPAAF
ncbi:hypothetical protein B0H17DRAFT_595701 [Mycena rosella]|uniref:F-box domain-containing protein n=1 Tax=Mycena rosella TaxID=1033263 RepID=A0AAD7DFR0_MYCRO|nr:hypothetical protein B0H17DRAFT_595701 [Mycena rosella]